MLEQGGLVKFLEQIKESTLNVCTDSVAPVILGVNASIKSKIKSNEITIDPLQQKLDSLQRRKKQILTQLNHLNDNLMSLDSEIVMDQSHSEKRREINKQLKRLQREKSERKRKQDLNQLKANALEIERQQELIEKQRTEHEESKMKKKEYLDHLKARREFRQNLLASTADRLKERAKPIPYLYQKLNQFTEEQPEEKVLIKKPQITTDEIYQHRRKYQHTLKEADIKRKNEKTVRNHSLSYFKHSSLGEYLRDNSLQKEKNKIQYEEKKNLALKRKQYSQIVKKLYAPKQSAKCEKLDIKTPKKQPLRSHSSVNIRRIKARKIVKTQEKPKRTVQVIDYLALKRSQKKEISRVLPKLEDYRNIGKVINHSHLLQQMSKSKERLARSVSPVLAVKLEEEANDLIISAVKHKVNLLMQI